MLEYGTDNDFRDGITALGLHHIVGIQSSTSLWPPGCEPLPPKPWSGRGRLTSLIRRDNEHKPISARQLAIGLPKNAFRRLLWREGSNSSLASRFAAVRVRPSHRDYWRPAPRPAEWLLIEWPAGEPEPTTYWLVTMPETIPRLALVNLAKLRWRIERDYQDLKHELGLGHYEGRGFITTPGSASLPTAFLLPNGRRSPLRKDQRRHLSKRLDYPTPSDPGALPIRP